MPLLNKFKNIFKKEKKAPKRKEVAIEPKIKKALPKKKAGEVYRILKEPHISEKSTDLFDQGKYTFRVFPWANKVEIKKAIGDLYGVRVKNVQIINIKPKSRILKGLEGKKRGYKKAIITLEAGEKIEILPH